MAETRAQALLKDAVVREVEEALQTKIDSLLGEGISKLDAKLDSRIAEMFEAIKLISSNGVPSQGGNEVLQTPGASMGVNSSSLTPPNTDGHRFRPGNVNNGYSGLTRLSRIEFPRFSGDRVKDWLFKIEQFFLIDHTPGDLKVSLAAIHFDDCAATWHQALMQTEAGQLLTRDWQCYREVLLERFGEILDDPIAELKSLQETEGILDYHHKFEQIITRVQLSEEYLVSAYLTGLSTDTQMNVRVFQPKSIRQCLMLGKLYESAHPKKVFSSGFRADLHSVAPKEDELMREESDFDEDSSRILGGNKGTEADSVVFQEQIEQEPENVLNSTEQTLGTLTNILRDCSHDQHPKHFSDGGHDNFEANSNNSTSWLSLQSDIESVSRLGAHSKGKICEKPDFQASEVIHKSLDTLAFEIASDVELEELDETVAVSIDKIELNLVTPAVNPIESFEFGGAHKVLDKMAKANIVFLGSCFHSMNSNAPWLLTDVTNSLTLLSECAREVEWVDVHSSLVFDPGIDDLYWFIGWDFTDLVLVPNKHEPKVGAMMSIDHHNWIFDPSMQSQEGIHVEGVLSEISRGIETSVILIFDPGGLNLLLHMWCCCSACGVVVLLVVLFCCCKLRICTSAC